jgi:hypothetical protein
MPYKTRRRGKKSFFSKKRGKTRKMKNSRGRLCKSKMTSCCPHMAPNSEGGLVTYAATTRMKLLHYKKKKYKLYTCCSMCATMMNELSKNDVKRFDRLYKVKKTKNGDLKLANRHTKKYVQIAKRVH